MNDHLGNTRVVVSDSGKVLQRSDYYAFGLPLNAIDRGINKYTYNGKELQPQTGLLDYGARQYDAAVGRWFGVDTESESYTETSSFAYVLNNPIHSIDPDGRNVYILTSDGRTVLAQLDDNPHIFYQQAASGQLSKLDPFGRDQGVVGAYLARTSDKVFNTLSTTASGEAYNGFQDYLRIRAQSKGRIALDEIEEYVINMLSAGGKASTQLSGSVLGARHHVFPKVFGGFRSWSKKYIYPLSNKIHKELHDLIESKLKQAGLPSHRGRGNSAGKWAQDMQNNPNIQNNVIKILKKVAKDIDTKYGTQIQKQLDQIIKNGDYKKIP